VTMNSPPISVHIGFVRETLGGLKLRQQDPQPFLERANIRRELIELPLARISGTQYQTLVLSLMDDLDDEMMGHLAKPLRRGSFVFLARASLFGALSLYVVLARWVKAHRLLTDEIHLSFRKEGDVAWVTLTGPSSRSQQHPTFLPVVYFKSLHILASWLIGERIKLTAVRFAGPCPIHGDEYARLFPGEIAFSAPVSAMGIPVPYLDRAVSQDVDSLHQFLRAAPGNLLWQYRATDLLSEKIRAILKDALPAHVDIAEAAQAVGFSQRTLHPPADRRRHQLPGDQGWSAPRRRHRLPRSLSPVDRGNRRTHRFFGCCRFSTGRSRPGPGVAPGVYRAAHAEKPDPGQRIAGRQKFPPRRPGKATQTRSSNIAMPCPTPMHIVHRGITAARARCSS
jgi:hypothetical protein